MKFLTALSEKLEIGHLPETVPLAEAFPKRSGYATLLDEKSTLVVLLCFESADSILDLKEAAMQIEETFLFYRREVDLISLIPFGHLSMEALADKQESEKLLDKLYRILTNKGLKVRRVPVASGNVFFARLLFFDKLRSVKLRTSRVSLKPILRGLLRVYGPAKLMSTIADILQHDKNK